MNDAVTAGAVFFWIIGIIVYLVSLTLCWDKVVAVVYFARASLVEKVIFFYFWGSISVVATFILWWLSGGIADFINVAVL